MIFKPTTQGFEPPLREKSVTGSGKAGLLTGFEIRMRTPVLQRLSLPLQSDLWPTWPCHHSQARFTRKTSHKSSMASYTLFMPRQRRWIASMGAMPGAILRSLAFGRATQTYAPCGRPRAYSISRFSWPIL